MGEDLIKTRRCCKLATEASHPPFRRLRPFSPCTTVDGHVHASQPRANGTDENLFVFGIRHDNCVIKSCSWTTGDKNRIVSVRPCVSMVIF